MVQQIVAQKATEIAHKLRDELKNGKPLAEAATQAGVKLEKLPAVCLVDEPPGATPAPETEAEKRERPICRLSSKPRAA